MQSFSSHENKPHFYIVFKISFKVTHLFLKAYAIIFKKSVICHPPMLNICIFYLLNETVENVYHIVTWIKNCRYQKIGVIYGNLDLMLHREISRYENDMKYCAVVTHVFACQLYVPNANLKLATFETKMIFLCVDVWI